jgi:hypothetical protein
MSIADSKSVARTAQFLVVEAKRAYGSPPVFETAWQTVWGAKVDRIDINAGTTPSVATVWFPSLSWDAPTGLKYGDMIRIRTDEYISSQRTVLFLGFFVKRLSDFSGGDEKKGSSYKRNAFVALDHRWLLKTTSPVFGQLTRSPVDYFYYGTENQVPIDGAFMWAKGRRCIFNEKGRPNCDPYLLSVYAANGGKLCDTPIFTDPQRGIYFTARGMIRYILSPLNNRAYSYFPVVDPNLLPGLENSDFDSVLNNILIDSLSVLDALDIVCKNLGWSFRFDWGNDNTMYLIFFKPGRAAGYSRSLNNPTILQKLYSPCEGEFVSYGVSQGKRILWSMILSEDIEPVINNPWGIGAPDQFEFTAQLVPAWLDSDLIPDSTDDYEHLYIAEADIQKETDPNQYSFFGYYHKKGSFFKRDVGRKWSLNETGLYSPSHSNVYDRGSPFMWENFLPPQYMYDSYGYLQYAPFARKLLPCLTVDKDSISSIGIKVEVSFDGGVTWQVVDAAITNLTDECGIYLDEPNLAEIVDIANGTITEGVLEGKSLNLFSSLCDDIINSRSFKDSEWRTRVRVTASVQMDQRIARQSPVDIRVSGSPFHHSQIFDFSEKYGLKKRAASSQFDTSDLPAWNIDDTDWCDIHLGGLRRANEDASISGAFTLERLWLGDGRGVPDFVIGDCIEKIEGREKSLAASYGGKNVFPEIIRIIYLPDKQKMQLVTRDLRFARGVIL